MKAIIYCRVSTMKKEQETSLARQKSELNKLADRYHFTIIDSIEEQESGYEIDREGILKMLDYFSEGEANCLLIQDETRLGRGNTRIALFHQLHKLNVSIYTTIHSEELELSESDSMGLEVVRSGRGYQRKSHTDKSKRGRNRAIEGGYDPRKNVRHRNHAAGRERQIFPIEVVVRLRQSQLIIGEITSVL